jgi:hypothetical protein
MLARSKDRLILLRACLSTPTSATDSAASGMGVAHPSTPTVLGRLSRAFLLALVGTAGS